MPMNLGVHADHVYISVPPRDAASCLYGHESVWLPHVFLFFPRLEPPCASVLPTIQRPRALLLPLFGTPCVLASIRVCSCSLHVRHPGCSCPFPCLAPTYSCSSHSEHHPLALRSGDRCSAVPMAAVVGKRGLPMSTRAFTTKRSIGRGEYCHLEI